MLKALGVPVGWGTILKRTAREVWTDHCLGLAAELAYYFFLALFPALLFIVALASFFPIDNLIGIITNALARVAPSEVLAIIQNQIVAIARAKNGGLLTLGMVGTIWSTSSGVDAIIDTLNRAYDIHDARPWWRVRLLALAFTLALAVCVLISTVLVVAGPEIAEHVADWLKLGAAFAWTWKIAQWPLIFVLVSLGVAVIYYFAPDVQQQWIWITPGSLFATFFWLVTSLGFRFYAKHFGSFNATYGAIGGVIVLLLWFYVSGLAVLVGAELNSEIEHASPFGKDPGEKVAGEKEALEQKAAEHKPTAFNPALTSSNCDLS